MSSTIWTPHAVSTNSRQKSARLWRAVEAQHKVSTRRLVDTLAEQSLLEEILEATKPAVPKEAAHLDYLLFTPFRYPPRRHGSRFRASGDPGVFYGAQARRTACAELGYWRWRFLTDSEGLATIVSAQTLFQVSVRGRSVELDEPPFSRQSKLWLSRDDYTATQRFGELARKAGVELIFYQSVRDPEKGRCGAVLHPSAFSAKAPLLERQTWFLTVMRKSVSWQRDGESFEFEYPARGGPAS